MVKYLGILIVIVANLAASIGLIFALLTLPLITLVFRGELTFFNWFRLLSIPAMLLLIFAFVWRLDPWGGKSTIRAWQKRTGPAIRERMVTNPFWRGLLWVGIVCQIIYVIVTAMKMKDLIK